jgi:hypothetical protein
MTNPLIDDGDAFRLAVKLGINIQFSGRCYSVSRQPEVNIHCEWEGDDHCALIRRAIVNVAAQMVLDQTWPM